MNQGGNGNRHRPRTQGASGQNPPPGGRRRRKPGAETPRPVPARPDARRPDAPAEPARPPVSAEAMEAAGGPPEVVLERLRVRVLDAVRELDRLRDENDALATRVAELEAASGHQASAALFDDADPDALRARVDGFIEALDAYLATDE